MRYSCRHGASTLTAPARPLSVMREKSKLLQQKGNLLWSVAGKPRDVLTLDQLGSRGSHSVCRPSLQHLSTLLSLRLLKWPLPLQDDLQSRVWTKAPSMVFIGCLLNHVFILEIIFEACLARDPSGVNNIWNKSSESQGGMASQRNIRVL